jgi:hypothetical protein
MLREGEAHGSGRSSFPSGPLVFSWRGGKAPAEPSNDTQSALRSRAQPRAVLTMPFTLPFGCLRRALPADRLLWIMAFYLRRLGSGREDFFPAGGRRGRWIARAFNRRGAATETPLGSTLRRGGSGFIREHVGAYRWFIKVSLRLPEEIGDGPPLRRSKRLPLNRGVPEGARVPRSRGCAHDDDHPRAQSRLGRCEEPDARFLKPR